MSEALDLQTWGVEELAMLEHTLATARYGEKRFADLLGYLSYLIVSSPARTGETLDIHPESHTVLHVPEQRHEADPLWIAPGRIA